MMKPLNRKFWPMALAFGMCAAGTAGFTACSDDDDVTTPTPPPTETLGGTLTENLTLTQGSTYNLSGALTVEEGVTLTIEPGVRIVAVDDDLVDYILVKQGAKIDAQGTAENPIVMTSELEEAGAWGGIHICGYAHTNAEGGTGSSEIGNATYGGNDDADNSGTLRYIRLEYTGFAFDEEHEANGISFYGVGNGTTVDHCQAYKGSDDGFEFFGGSVNVSNMVVTDCSDDSFDWTEGWNGRGTNLVAVQESEDVLGYACDCLIEADNNENNNQATPIANPELSNLILVGSGSDTEGVRLRRGTYVRMDNAKICGKGLPLVVESTYTEQALLNGTDGAHISNTQLSGNISSENGIYTSTEFQADGNKTYQNISYPTYDDVLAECSWMAGWTRSWGTTSTEAPEEISGTVTENMTLVEGKTYRLNGAVTVEAGATLTIQPGVRVVAVNDDLVDYILVKQGAKIDAQGTAENPIVMTSELEEAGAWGGIHICGYAHTNAEGGTGSSEIGNATYGGNNDADNSGTLRYIRLEYTGYAFDEEHEANGISFYGVGNGTTVDHCEAYKGSDDGFEFFGGSVNVSNMVVVSCSDDSFDWTEGWNGRGTNLVAYQEAPATLGYACDCLIEADNNENNNQASPIANPELTNLILVGNGSDSEGVRLRRGTRVRMDNAQICGKGKALVVESTYTEQALLDGTDGAHISNTTISNNVDSENGIYTNDAFLADEGNSVNTELNFTPESIQAACSWTAGWTKF